MNTEHLIIFSLILIISIGCRNSEVASMVSLAGRTPSDVCEGLPTLAKSMLRQVSTDTKS